MARPTNTRATNDASATTGTTATTITLQNPSSEQPPTHLVLRLKPKNKKKKVSWKEGTVDNEFLGRRSSKKCCIFHKEKSFDEDNSDEEDNNDCQGHRHDHDHHHHHHHGSEGENSASSSDK